MKPQDALIGIHNPQGAGKYYPWYVCIVLMLAFGFSIMDRTVLSLLIPAIEHEFTVSDTTMSLMQGAAFSVFYIAFGFPLARWVDGGNRRTLLIIGLVVWCVATASCGMAGSITELFFARIAVAIGEAALAPLSVSLISDYFHREKRTFALTLYQVGAFLGAAGALGGGGALLRWLGPDGVTLPVVGLLPSWRLVFILLGLSGFLVLPLILSIREPARLGENGKAAGAALPFNEVLAIFKSRRVAIFLHNFGFALIATGTLAVNAWSPTMFIRIHQWSAGNAGLRLGALTLIICPLGAFCGSYIAGRFSKQGRLDGKPLVALIASLAAATGAIALTHQSAAIALSGFGFLNLGIGFTYGVTQASLSELVPNRVRGMAVALFAVGANLIAGAVGPFLVAVLTDHVFHDKLYIGMSLRIVTMTSFCAAALVFRIALRPHREAVYRQLQE